jgi:hypothetical protein
MSRPVANAVSLWRAAGAETPGVEASIWQREALLV